MSIDQNDHRCLRCRMLGHEVKFSYCRQPGREIPCGKIFDCWFETFDVKEFIHSHYTQEQIQQILAPAPAKMSSLLDLIRQAQNNSSPDE